MFDFVGILQLLPVKTLLFCNPPNLESMVSLGAKTCPVHNGLGIGKKTICWCRFHSHRFIFPYLSNKSKYIVLTECNSVGNTCDTSEVSPEISMGTAKTKFLQLCRGFPLIILSDHSTKTGIYSSVSIHSFNITFYRSVGTYNNI